jgi:hypothetical protein
MYLDSIKFRVLLGSSLTLMNQERSEFDFGSAAYMDMIENLCYFKPSNRLSDVSQLIHRSSVEGSSKAAYCSRAFSDERFQSSQAEVPTLHKDLIAHSGLL